MENAYYSVITPEGCAAILWKDRAYSEKAAEALHLTANDLKKLGIIDDVINEPLGGAHKDYEKAALLVKEAIVRKGVSPEALKEQRYERFRNIAFYAEEKAEESAGTGENAAQ